MKVGVFLFWLSCLMQSFDSCDAGLIQWPVNDEPWEFLILAQFWPGTSCVYFRSEGCTIPPEVTDGFTIHGLWPSRDAEVQPAFCNTSLKFNFSEIQSLESQLNKFWPYYNKTGNRSDLWEHEWDKHGTCAYTVPAISGELNYFTQTLQLYSQLDIYGTLNSIGIVPKQDTLYNLSDIFKAVSGAYHVIPQIECYYAEEMHYLDQVYMCYDKTLTPRDCPQAHRSRSVIQRSGSSLQFYSEKDDTKFGTRADKRKHESYFIDCPKDGMVYYIPKPQV